MVASSADRVLLACMRGLHGRRALLLLPGCAARLSAICWACKRMQRSQPHACMVVVLVLGLLLSVLVERGLLPLSKRRARLP